MVQGRSAIGVLRGGARPLRCVGSGPPLLLMHTVRTLLDYFQLVIPQLTDTFTVYAVDFPGHGLVGHRTRRQLRRASAARGVVRVVEELDFSELTLAGESMGATLALTASVELGDRVRRVVAFNTYDFADGVKRASLFALGRGKHRGSGSWPDRRPPREQANRP